MKVALVAGQLTVPLEDKLKKKTTNQTKPKPTLLKGIEARSVTKQEPELLRE